MESGAYAEVVLPLVRGSAFLISTFLWFISMYLIETALSVSSSVTKSTKPNPSFYEHKIHIAN